MAKKPPVTDFVSQIALANALPEDHLLVQYLHRKTQAADRGSKARRSLGNLYALKVLAESYLDGKASRFTDLLARMKSLPFGSKLQNHPLDNRLNDEFGRQMEVTGNMLPVQAVSEGIKVRVISEQLLASHGANPHSAAKFIVDAVDHYVGVITSNQSDALEEMEEIETVEDLSAFFASAFEAKADARLFEIVSYVLLAEHFRGHHVFLGTSAEEVEKQELQLFRTGRTNANDGGIDFVLTPIGRFFQVTETVDFKKYFLDFQKVNRFQLTFVVKVEASGDEVRAKIKRDAERSGLYKPETIDMYMGLFEEIFTLEDLTAMAEKIDPKSLVRIKDELSLQFQLEYGLLD